MSGATLLKSTVHRGTAFEKRSLSVLEKYLSMSLCRVGGKSDGGVDLQGWWWLPAVSLSRPSSSSLPSLSSASSEVLVPSSSVDSEMIPRRRIRVLAQCKATKQKMGPNIVREMEGVLFQYSDHSLLGSSSSNEVHLGNSNRAVAEAVVGGVERNRRGHIPTVALLVSQSPFTRATILRAISSSVPFFLLHLPEPVSELRADEIEGNDGQTGSIGAAVWNKALRGKDGLVGDQIEARWERNPDGNGGRPGLWWDGRPMKNWVPSSSTP